jgi:hypothetical protein
MPAFDRTEDVEVFLHRFVALEEDHFLFTSALDNSGYGWFRFGNVLPFERASGCRQKLIIADDAAGDHRSAEARVGRSGMSQRMTTR